MGGNVGMLLSRSPSCRLNWNDLVEQLEAMEIALGEGNRHQALEILSKLVPEYNGQQAVHSDVE